MLKNILLLISTIFLLSGCSVKKPYEEISFSTWGSVSEMKIIKQIISDYEKENPNVKIKLLHFPQNYFQKIHLLFASNTAPDVVFINNLNLPIYQKYLQDLTNSIEKKDYFPSAIKGLEYENKLLAIPRDLSNLLIYVNLDKTSLPHSDWSLEDLLTYAQTNTTEKTFGISFDENVYFLTPYLYYYEEKLDENLLLTESQGINFYKSLRDKYKVAPNKSQIGSSTLAQMFLEEKIVLYLSGRWMYPKIKETANFNWAVINFPKGKLGYPCDVSGWAINKNSKNKQAALDFVKYLASEKSSIYFAQTGLIVPARIKSAKYLNNEIHNEKVFLKIAETSQNNYVDKNYKKLVDKLNYMLSQ